MHIFTPSIIGAFNLSIAFLKISAACKPTFTLKCMIKIAYTFTRWKKLSILKLILSKKDISSIRLGNLVSNLKFCKAYRCCYFPEICWTTERAFYTVYDRAIDRKLTQEHASISHGFSCSRQEILLDVLFAARKRVRSRNRHYAVGTMAA